MCNENILTAFPYDRRVYCGAEGVRGETGAYLVTHAAFLLYQLSKRVASFPDPRKCTLQVLTCSRTTQRPTSLPPLPPSRSRCLAPACNNKRAEGGNERGTPCAGQELARWPVLSSSLTPGTPTTKKGPRLHSSLWLSERSEPSSRRRGAHSESVHRQRPTSAAVAILGRGERR